MSDELMDKAVAMARNAAKRLNGRTVIVTGGGTAADGPIGIGAAICTVLALHGANVVVADRVAEAGERTVGLVKSVGGSARYVGGDVSDRNDCGTVADEAISMFGRIDGLVNNAATSRRASILDASEADFVDTYRINTVGPLFMTQACAPHLAVHGGTIVNIGSIGAVRPMGSSGYSESKAALIALSQQSAFTLGRKGVRVNCVHPGHMYAPMTANAGDQTRARRASQNMLGTEGTGWDIANAVLFLSSDEARWITGLSICVDAGATLLTPVSFEQFS